MIVQTTCNRYFTYLAPDTCSVLDVTDEKGQFIGQIVHYAAPEMWQYRLKNQPFVRMHMLGLTLSDVVFLVMKQHKATI